MTANLQTCSSSLEALNRIHCGGECKQGDECICQFPTKLFESSESKVAYVGGGLSSIEGAKIAQEQRGANCIILELAPFLGGIWQTSANHESRIQVDPVSFRPLDDTTPIAPTDPSLPFDSIYPDRKQVLSRMGFAVEKFKLREKTVFNVAVLGFEVLESEKLVRVRMRCYYGDLGKVGCKCCSEVASEWGDKEFFYDFKELHIRTGSLTSWQHRGEHKFPGQDTFGGRVVAGVGNDISVPEFKDKNVVIIGMGAFSVENTRRAIQGGAKTITVLSRKFDKLLFPEIATYYLRSTLQSDDAETDENLLKMWKNVFRIIEAGASSTGLSKVILNPSCVRTVGGEKHFIFAKGLPSCASNTFMLAHQYGLVDIFEDEVKNMVVGEDGIPTILTKRGQTLQADITIKCMGFETDEGLLANHTVTDSYFIDGCSWVTHNLRADRVNGEGLIGPKVRVSNFLISYYEDAQEYERCIGRLIQSPAAFEELNKMDPVKNVSLVSNVDYFSTLVLSEKLANNSDPVIQSILNENRETRREMYQKYLPMETFLQHDKEMWDKLCSYFSKLSGKSALVPYPFEFLLEEA